MKSHSIFPLIIAVISFFACCNMALVEASPEVFKVVSSFKVNEGFGPHWARPAIYYGMLLVRYGDVLISYKVSQD